MTSAVNDIVTGAPVFPPVGVLVIARILGITERSVQSLAKRNVVVSIGRGKYDLLRSVQGYIHYLKSDIPEDPEKMSPKERKDFYDGNLLRRKDALEAGAVVRAEEARAAMAELIKQITLSLETLPEEVDREEKLTERQFGSMEDIINTKRVILNKKLLQIAHNAKTENAAL